MNTAKTITLNSLLTAKAYKVVLTAMGQDYERHKLGQQNSELTAQVSMDGVTDLVRTLSVEQLQSLLTEMLGKRATKLCLDQFVILLNSQTPIEISLAKCHEHIDASIAQCESEMAKLEQVETAIVTE